MWTNVRNGGATKPPIASILQAPFLVAAGLAMMETVSSAHQVCAPVTATVRSVVGCLAVFRKGETGFIPPVLYTINTKEHTGILHFLTVF